MPTRGGVRQLLHLRSAEATGEVDGVSAAELGDQLDTREFLVRRPLLEAIDPNALGPGGAPSVLLVDEVDRADDAFEAHLLEVLGDMAITVPQLGTIRAEVPPVVVLTSNRTRDLHDALKRRCLYHWVEHPDPEREAAIIRLRVPEANDVLVHQVAEMAARLRAAGVYKPPGLAESIDWTHALVLLGHTELEEQVLRATAGSTSRPRRSTTGPAAPGSARPWRLQRPLAAWRPPSLHVDRLHAGHSMASLEALVSVLAQ